ncbi:MAG: ABC transporter ATP-binding protein [Clostridiales bacterium]|jgi:ATP-binding cassette subfamily B multidrug efflux pump|nr:ABC transporter ATP-binding protein [Clostridiales bacterium]
MKKTQNKGTLSRVLQYIGKYKWLFFITVFLAAVSVALTLYLPVLFGDAIDTITEAGAVQFDTLMSILLWAGIVAAATALVQWLMNVVNNRITYSVAQDIRNAAIAKIQKLPFSYLDAHPQGDTVSRVITDVDQFCDGLLMGFTQLFTGVITILGTVGFMISIHWQTAAAVILLTPLSLLVARFIATRTYHMFRVQSEVRGVQTGFVGEMIEHQKIVDAFHREEENQKRFDQINDELQVSSVRALFFSALVNPTTRLISNTVYAVAVFLGALSAISGAMTIGALSCLLSYAVQYAKPFNEITGVVTELQNAMACAGRVFELLDEEEQPADGTDALQQVRGDVTLDSVSFSYDKSKALIEKLNLQVSAGQRIAIVGPTGCGKTTLINLLMRFYDVDGGCICVDGADIRTVTRHSLRGNFGMVLQDTWLCSGTVRENIAFGRPDATEEEIVTAAKASHADSFIRRLPQGYDTVLGEESSLSQGQRQLLCISRIMLSLPPMLILDEATSSIDTRTEMKIQDAFAKMMQGRTSFIVAHRLSTIRDSDMILVMRDGKIVEQGSHKTLLEKEGFYYHLYNSQFSHGSAAY